MKSKEWWDAGKVKIKSLSIEVSKRINKSQNNIKISELKLENLKNNENNIDVNGIQKLEIREFCENQAEAAILRSKTG